MGNKTSNTHTFFFLLFLFFFFLPRDYNAVIALIKDSNVMVVRGIVTSIVTTTTVGGITFVRLCVRVGMCTFIIKCVKIKHLSQFYSKQLTVVVFNNLHMYCAYLITGAK